VAFGQLMSHFIAALERGILGKKRLKNPWTSAFKQGGHGFSKLAACSGLALVKLATFTCADHHNVRSTMHGHI